MSNEARGSTLWNTPMFIEDIQLLKINMLTISALKRLKYLIVINRMNVIVNSGLINCAINRTILSIINVP